MRQYVNFLVDLWGEIYYNRIMKPEYKLIRAKRKTVGMRFDSDGVLCVRAPYWATRAQIDGILAKNAKNIEKMRQSWEKAHAMYGVSDSERAALRTLAARMMPRIVAVYAAETGLRPEKIRIGEAKKRFGSCSSKRTLAFSLYLMLYPYAAIEYVALHEVCHIAHMDHSKAFYIMIEKYMPDYRQREKLLRPESIMSAQEALEIYRNI